MKVDIDTCVKVRGNFFIKAAEFYACECFHLLILVSLFDLQKEMKKVEV